MNKSFKYTLAICIILQVASVVSHMGVANAATQQEQKNVARQKIIKLLLEKHFRAWIENAIVIEAIKQQNSRHESLQESVILELDKQWRAERKVEDKPLIESILSTPLSDYLKQIKAEKPKLYNEIFVMDNKGLNVGQSDVTSDYWQGDEAKWKETYLNGPGAIHIGDYEFDESTQKYQTQLSVSITDPDTDTVIGAITLGLDAWEILRETAKLN